MDNLNTHVKFILLEACNYEDHPPGGQLNFARLLIKLYGSELGTVGYPGSPDEPVGVWFKKVNETGFVRDHFNMGSLQNKRTKYWFPRRIRALLDYRRFRKKIHTHPSRNFFIQEHALLIGFQRDLAASVCYRFPGVESQLKKSRFRWAIPLARLFDWLFFRSTLKADVLLASADDDAIAEMRSNSFGYVKERDVHFFPTRVDTSVFVPKREFVRPSPVRLVSCGRLHWVKGWDLILEALATLKDRLDFVYTYLGDGPDRESFYAKAESLGLKERVQLAGFLKPSEIAARLREADLFLMASFMEGWPTSLVEAYVIGLPIVTTSVSGARAIVNTGVNGFVCSTRESEEFARSILLALELDPQMVARESNPELYSVAGLRNVLGQRWSVAKA